VDAWLIQKDQSKKGAKGTTMIASLEVSHALCLLRLLWLIPRFSSSSPPAEETISLRFAGRGCYKAALHLRDIELGDNHTSLNEIQKLGN
jgi:hypothetical protein